MKIEVLNFLSFTLWGKLWGKLGISLFWIVSNTIHSKDIYIVYFQNASA